MAHEFIFKPGTWLGEGTIHFSSSDEEIKFYTKWIIEAKEGKLFLNQIVEMQGIDQKTVNHYVLSQLGNENFQIELTNDILKNVIGNGSFKENTIFWQFNQHGVFEGYELYEKKEKPHLYSFHAEYSSEELFRTIIDGIIWKKE